MSILTSSTSSKPLPNEVTHLDLIKSFAVIMMLIDHIGYYFFPGELWFRTLGRIGGVPVWFFLVGYAIGREIPSKLIIGAGALIVAKFAFFQQVFALNVLVPIMIIRLILDSLMKFILKSPYIFGLSIIMFTLGFWPTNAIMDYGTLGLLFAIVGYFVRHRERLIETTFLTKGYMNIYFVYAFVAFCILQNAIFGFSNAQFFVLAVLAAVIMIILINIRPMTFPKIQGFAKHALQFGGRRTLEIYVGHLLIFKLLLFLILTWK